MFGSVARNFSILTVTQIADAALNFLFIAFIARQFGPALFGTYVLIGASVRSVSLIVNAGVGPIAMRELARCRNDPADLFDDIVSLRIALGVLGYGVLMLALGLFSEDEELVLLMAVAALTLLIDAFKESYTAYFTANERFAVPCLYGLSLTVVAVVTGVILVLAGHGVLAVIVSNVLLTLAVTLVWTLRFRAGALRFRLRVRLEAWHRLIMLVLPFAPIHVSNQLNRVINVIALGRLPGPLPTDQAVGYYGPAQSTTNAVVTLVSGLRRVLIPPVTVRLSQGYTVTHELGLALKLVAALFCLPLVLGTSYMAPALIELLFGAQYAPSAAALVVLGWAGALQIIAIVPEGFLFSHPDHELKDYIPGAVISVLTNITLCVVLIGSHGFMGAAAAALAARCVYFAYGTYYLRRHMAGEFLRLTGFLDVVVLSGASYAAWALAFGAIGNPWLALLAAGIATAGLTTVFLLHLRSRVAAGQS